MSISESQAKHKHILTPAPGETEDQMWARAWQFTNNVCFDNLAYAMIKKTGGRVCGPGVDCDKIIEVMAPHRIYDLVRSAGSTAAEPIFDDTHHTGKPADFAAPLAYDQSPIPPQPPMPTQPPGREEALDELNWLDAYYASPEGLQRPNGLSLNGKPDFEGIAAWYLDVYQRERMKMASRADARAAYVSDIRHTDEWKQKHPGETR